MKYTTHSHGSCKNNVSGFYEYCMVYGLGTPSQDIHPIGYCRDNKRKGKPCEHKTEDEAKECYAGYELAHFVNGDIQQSDLLLPEVLADIFEEKARQAREEAIKKAELLAKMKL